MMDRKSILLLARLTQELSALPEVERVKRLEHFLVPHKLPAEERNPDWIPDNPIQEIERSEHEDENEDC